MNKINAHVTSVVYHEGYVKFETDELTCEQDVEDMFEQISNRGAIAQYSIDYSCFSIIVIVEKEDDITGVMFTLTSTMQFTDFNSFYEFITGLFS